MTPEKPASDTRQAQDGNDQKKWWHLHPTVIATGWVSFFTDLGSEMIYPLLPFLITGGSGIGGLGAGKTVLGLIEGVAEGLPAIVRLFSGMVADRVRNRKWLILFGYGLSSVAKPLIGLAGSAWHVLALRSTDKFGKGIRTAPRDALVADLAQQRARGWAFGYQRAMDHLGAVLGALVAWWLFWQMGLTIRTVIVVSALPSVLCLLTIVGFIKEKPDRQIATGVAGRRLSMSQLQQLPRHFWLFLVAAGAFALANSSDAFLLLRSGEMGLSLAWAVLAWAELHVVKSLCTLAGGRLSDIIPRRSVLAGGWALYALVYCGFALLSGPIAPFVLFALYGVFFGATEATVKATVADLVPEPMRGTAYGVMGALEGILTVTASLVAGILWDLTGAATIPLLLAAGLSGGAALWVLVTLPAVTQRADTAG